MSELDEQGMGAVVDRLAQRFPSLERNRIQAIVDEEHHKLEGRPVQDFVPVLVEHAALERLREEADPVTVAVSGDDLTAEPPVSDGFVELDPMEIERRAREGRGGFLFGDLGGGPS